MIRNIAHAPRQYLLFLALVRYPVNSCRGCRNAIFRRICSERTLLPAELTSVQVVDPALGKEIL
jgi:hypothetical protein